LLRSTEKFHDNNIEGEKEMSILKLLSPIGAIISYINYKHDRLHLATLIKNGLRVGQNVYISPNVQIDSNYPYLIEIGDNCRISALTTILAHDASTFQNLGITRLASVKILEGTFIGARAIILPGVTIGPWAMIAAGSVVNRDIGEGKIAAGNPARPYGDYSDFLKKYRDTIRSVKVFKKEDIEKGLVTSDNIITTIENDSIAFVRGIPTKDPYYINTDIEQLRKLALKAFNNLIMNLDTTTQDSTDCA
jgi:maltose O-acetyltransferase